MSTTWIVIIAGAIWVLVALFAWSLCKMSAMADKDRDGCDCHPDDCLSLDCHRMRRKSNSRNL